jgi:DNA ligase-1
MLLASLVEATERVAATRSRSAKQALLAQLVAQLSPDEIAVGASCLAGELPTGPLGVGYATVQRLSATPAASSATLTLLDVMDGLTRVQATRGSGSQAQRLLLLGQLYSRATAAEQRFLTHWFIGELRQGALQSLLLEGIAEQLAPPSAPSARRLRDAG